MKEFYKILFFVSMIILVPLLTSFLFVEFYNYNQKDKKEIQINENPDFSFMTNTKVIGKPTCYIFYSYQNLHHEDFGYGPIDYYNNLTSTKLILDKLRKNKKNYEILDFDMRFEFIASMELVFSNMNTGIIYNLKGEEEKIFSDKKNELIELTEER